MVTEEIYIQAIERIRRESKGLERQLWKLIRDFILGLDTKKGLVLKGSDSKFNKSEVAKLNSKIEDFLRKSGYTKSVRRFLTNFDELDSNIIKLHQDTNKIKVKKNLLSVIKKTAITKVTSDLVGASLNISMKDPIREVLFDAVVTGGSLTDILRNVRQQIITTEGNKSLLLRHVTQISRDALQQYNGRQHNAIRREFGLNALLYVNSLVKDSRPQCRRWRRMEIIKYSELDSEIQWAYRNGKGMIPKTTKETFIKFRGGYACRHEAIPTRA